MYRKLREINTERDKRGSVVRRRKQPDVNLPTNWAEFRKIVDDKTVSSSPDMHLLAILPSNHEEADNSWN